MKDYLLTLNHDAERTVLLRNPELAELVRTREIKTPKEEWSHSEEGFRLNINEITIHYYRTNKSSGAKETTFRCIWEEWPDLHTEETISSCLKAEAKLKEYIKSMKDGERNSLIKRNPELSFLIKKSKTN